MNSANDSGRSRRKRATGSQRAYLVPPGTSALGRAISGSSLVGIDVTATPPPTGEMVFADEATTTQKLINLDANEVPSLAKVETCLCRVLPQCRRDESVKAAKKGYLRTDVKADSPNPHLQCQQSVIIPRAIFGLTRAPFIRRDVNGGDRAHRLELSAERKERLLAHPPEPSYPCYVSVLGELAKLVPREEPRRVYR